MSFGERFLSLPDLFPGRASGEHWGGAELGLDFPGSPVQVKGLSQLQAEAISQHFEGVSGSSNGSRSPTRLTVFRAPLADFSPDEVQSFDFDLRYLESSVLVAGWHLMARFDWTPELSAAMWTPHEQGFLLTTAFENLTRALVAYRLIPDGGALVHSAAGGGADSAYLFVGPSGAGKTTIWSLLRDDGANVLCDDINAVLRVDGRFVVSSTPFSGLPALREGSLSARPLSEILFLRQGAAPAKRPMSRAEAVSRLFSSAPWVNRDRYREDRLLDTLVSLCRQVPAAEFTFSKQAGLWTWLESQGST